MNYQVHLCNEGGLALKTFNTSNLELAVETAGKWHELMLQRLAPVTYRQAQFVVIHKRNAQGDFDGIASFHHH